LALGQTKSKNYADACLYVKEWEKKGNFFLHAINCFSYFKRIICESKQHKPALFIYKDSKIKKPIIYRVSCVRIIVCKGAYG